jgi:hypothetical protein
VVRLSVRAEPFSLSALKDVGGNQSLKNSRSACALGVRLRFPQLEGGKNTAHQCVGTSAIQKTKNIKP